MKKHETVATTTINHNFLNAGCISVCFHQKKKLLSILIINTEAFSEQHPTFFNIHSFVFLRC